MNVYLFATLLGLLGLMALAALGLSHGHSPGAHRGTPHQAGHHHGHHQLGHRHATAHSTSLNILLLLTSPRVLLSVLTGFGLCGLLLGISPLARVLPGPLLPGVALVGGVLFERALVQPYWNLLMRFQSRPAESLASVTLSRARAVTDFDAQGQGLVALEFEGEVRQLLATLDAHQRPARSPRRGTNLLITSIDEVRNRCTVSVMD